MASETAVPPHKIFALGHDIGPRKAFKIPVALGTGRLEKGRRQHRAVPMFRGLPSILLFPFRFLGFVFGSVRGADECCGKALAAVTRDAAELLSRMGL